MEGRRFDDWARLIATGASRRRLFKAAVGSVLTGLLYRFRAGKVAEGHTPTGDLSVIEYFALGDSVASGHGLIDDSTSCHRSALAYPFKVAADLGTPGVVAFAVRHLACSGASALKPVNPDDPNHWFRHQVSLAVEKIEELPSDRPILVSITIGANDFGWLQPSVLVHLIEDDNAFERWVTETTEAVATEVRAQVKRLLAFPNVVIVLTQYHNPINKDSIIFYATDEIRLTSCVDLFGRRRCYERTEFAIHALNEALAVQVVERLKSPRVAITPNLHEAFHGHEGPGGVSGVPGDPVGLCGFSPPSTAQTWVQFPGDPTSNSGGAIAGLPSLVGGRGGAEFTGDCFHPNEAGAQAFADAVVAEARQLLGPKIIAGPVVINIATNTALVTWTTDKPSVGIVEYGLSPKLGRERPRKPGKETTEHQVELDNLKPGETYYYRVRSTNAIGEAVSDVFEFSAACQTGRARCEEACIDLSSDPNNCGACGTICPSGICDRGVCAPLLLGRVQIFAAACPGNVETRFSFAPGALSGVDPGPFCDFPPFSVTIVDPTGVAKVYERAGNGGIEIELPLGVYTITDNASGLTDTFELAVTPTNGSCGPEPVACMLIILWLPGKVAGGCPDGQVNC